LEAESEVDVARGSRPSLVWTVGRLCGPRWRQLAGHGESFPLVWRADVDRRGRLVGRVAGCRRSAVGVSGVGGWAGWAQWLRGAASWV